jgi:PAS domain S-box-containing protein
MMSAHEKTKHELTAELSDLHRRLDKLEVLEREHHGTLEALAESERRYRSVIDTAGSVILCLDREGRILEWNRAAERLYGSTRSEVLGQNYLEQFLPDDVRPAVAADIAKVLTGTPTEGFENPVRSAGGDERLLLWNVSPLEDAAGVFWGIVAIGQDITERARAESEQRRLQAELQQAQKLESLEVMAGGIAQEFNELLTQILASAARSRVIEDSNDTTRALVRDIERAARAAIDVANQMLTYAGQRSIDLYAVFLNRQIDEVATLVQAVIQTDARLEYRLATDLPPVMAHPGLLQQMLINLVTNASEALPESAGAIMISTGLTTVDRQYIRNCYLGEHLAAGEVVYLEVRDDGVGMDDHVKARMFDPFFSTNVPRRGLGLAAVLGIVRGHGGAIHVDSAPGQGTTIRVLFPKPQQVPFTSADPASEDPPS